MFQWLDVEHCHPAWLETQESRVPVSGEESELISDKVKDRNESETDEASGTSGTEQKDENGGKVTPRRGG